MRNVSQDHLVPASDLYWNFTGLVPKVIPPPPPDAEPQLQPLPEEEPAPGDSNIVFQKLFALMG